MTRLILALTVLMVTTDQSHADIIFNFTYDDVADASGFGFDDATFGAARRATVDAVGDYINTVFDHDGTVDINWSTSTNAPTASTLASMGAFFFNNSGVSNGFVFDHATTGIDPLPGNPDGTGQVNFGRIWNSELDAPASNEFDLFTVVLHELAHSFGFASLLDENGDNEIAGTVSVYDTLLEDAAGNRLVTGTTFTGDSSVFTSGDLFIDVGDGTLELFAPGTFQPGSSISHFDFSVPDNNVLFPSIAPGVANREFTSSDLAVLGAIGLNVVAVPEPGSGLVFGMFGLLFVARRRKR